MEGLIVDRDALGRTLAGMTLSEVEAVRDAALVQQEEEERRQRGARSDDPLGTIRCDAANDTMWVRTAGRQWGPWLCDDHGLEMEDHELGWADLPVVGKMPQSWIDDMARYEDDEDDGPNPINYGS